MTCRRVVDVWMGTTVQQVVIGLLISKNSVKKVV